MGIASLVLGIISFILGMIPVFGIIAFIPAIVGLVLGIVHLVKVSKTGESKALGIAGIVLTSLAVLFITFWTFIVGVGIAADPEGIIREIEKEIQNEYPNGYEKDVFNY